MQYKLLLSFNLVSLFFSPINSAEPVAKKSKTLGFSLSEQTKPLNDIPDSPEKSHSSKESPHKLIIDLIQRSTSDKDKELFFQSWHDEEMMARLNEENTYENEDLMCGRAYVGNSRSRSELMGMVLYKSQNEGDQLYIDSLCIAKNHQRCGYASAMIDHLTKTYNPKEIRALVSEAGEPFFYGIGFKKDQKDHDYMVKRIETKKASPQKRK